MSEEIKTEEITEEIEEFDEEELETFKKNSTFKRIVAWIFLALIAVMLCIFIYMVFTGSQYIIPMLFVLIILPFAAYIMIWLKDVFSK